MNPTILKKLRQILAELYPDEPSIRRVAGDAGISLLRVTLNSTSDNNWHSVFGEALHVNRVDALLFVAEDEYSTNEVLQHACAAFRRTVNQAGRIDADSRPSINEEKLQHIQRASNNPENRKTGKQGIAKHDKEPTSSETDHQQRLQVENALRSHPDFLVILQKSDFVPSEERKGRELTVVRPKVAVTCTLPIAISKGSCQIEFNDPFLRGLTIELAHEDTLKQLIIGRHTPIEWQARKFIAPLNDGNFELSIGNITIVLSKADATDLCNCIDEVTDIYVASMIEAEMVLEGWGLPLERLFEGDDSYGYEILLITIKTWKQMFQFAKDRSNLATLDYKFYTTNSSIEIKTNVDAHAEIKPKVYISGDGLPNDFVSLLYVTPYDDHDKLWQDKVGPKGLWTVDFTKKWILETFLSAIQNPNADDRSRREANPKIFWTISDLHLFEYHLDIIHHWVCHCHHINIPTNLFITYCQAFNQLLLKAVIEDESDGLGYVVDHVSLLVNGNRGINKNGSAYTYENLRFILADNLKYLQQVAYIRYDRLDYMFRGHYVLLRDFKISSTQSAINNFKKALWPLFERASFESRFCHLG